MNPSVANLFLLFSLFTDAATAIAVQPAQLTVTRDTEALVHVNGNPVTDVKNTVSSAASAVTNAAATAASAAETALAKALLGDLVVFNFNLDTASVGERNFKVVLCFCSIVLAAAVGYLADARTKAEHRATSNAPSYLVLAILAMSYVILIPGLVTELFSFLMGVTVLGLNILVTTANDKPSSITESTFGMIKLMCDTGGWVGAILVFTYAVIVPAIKLTLLIVAEMWRGSSDVAKVRSSRRYIHFVQFISKWACPDMFAYILLLYLFHHIDENGDNVIHTPAELGIGFACFSTFAVVSTFATLMVHAPELPDEVEADDKPPMAIRWFGLGQLHVVTVALFIAFSGLFLIGLFIPCMGMRLLPSLLVEPNGPLPEAAMPLIEELNLEDIVSTDVSMVRATKALAGYILEGELNDIFAFIMMLVFAMVLPMLDMCTLLWASSELSAQPSQMEAASRLIRVAKWLKHICMMDVALMGIVVITFAGAAYKAQGVTFFLMSGIWVLLIAEIIHYFTYYLVHDAVKWGERTPDKSIAN